MKKLFTAILVGAMMLIGSKAFGQVVVGAGYTMYDQDETKYDTQYYFHGFYAGADYYFHLSDNLRVVPGLYFSRVFNNEYISAWKESYISVPVRVNYALPLGRKVKAIAFAGPNLQYGLSSKFSDSSMYKDTDYKRFDVKVGGGLGVELFDIVRIVAGGDYGLLSRTPGDLRTHQLYAGVGLMF